MKTRRRQQREAIGADMAEIMDMEDMDGVEEGATEVLLGSEEQEALEQALGYVKRPSISDGDGKRGRREKTEDAYSGSGEQSIEISGSERNKSERMKKLRRQQREAIGADMDEIMDMEDMDGVEPERNEGEY